MRCTLNLRNYACACVHSAYKPIGQHVTTPIARSNPYMDESHDAHVINETASSAANNDQVMMGGAV